MITLYHGSNVDIQEIDLCRSKRGKDFGCGFYLNANKQQAFDMALRTTRMLMKGEPIINTYLFDDIIIRLARYHYKHFTNIGDFESFVLV